MSLQKMLKAVLGGAAIAACSSASLPGSLFAAESLTTNAGRFEIPFDMTSEQTEGQYAVLFGSQDGGASWEQLQVVPAAQQGFPFQAARDGRYTFAVRMMDAQGKLNQPIQGAEPELEIVVDTTRPDLQLELYEVAPGQVMARWLASDPSLMPSTLTVEYSDGVSGRWKTANPELTASGQAAIRIPPGSVVVARASISDAAENIAEATARLMSQNAVPSTASPLVQSQAAGLNSGAMGPSPFHQSPATPNNGIAGNGLAIPAAPAVGMASGVPAAGMLPGGAVASSNGGQAYTGQPNTAVAYPNQAFSGQIPVQGINGMAGSAMAPAAPLAGFGTTMSAGPAGVAPVQSAGTYGPGNYPAPAIPVSTSTGGLLVNNRVFELAYQLQDVGPSGVSAVELFVTEDGGQQWFRYGTDPDLKSPIRVDMQGEGTFGFAIRVRNGVGFASPPPQPGEVPEIVVTIDQTAPQIEFAQPVLQPDGSASVHLAWRVADSNPGQNPVRLEYAVSPAGPWSPVFDWQPDQGGQIWMVNAATPPSVYFRLLARDAAGNVSSAQSATPILIDLKRPVARLINVQVPNPVHNASF
ncbi:MAG: hypothetical protein KDA85_06950 [Planctomycetaceae bacterium]|nr:hypothetical protein [Planctomycetaceae bacterium]